MRILHIAGPLGQGNGIANVVMNYCRSINRDEVQFDFLSFKNTRNDYAKEVKELGGRVFYFTKPTLKNYLKGKNELKRFFAEHKDEYKIVHNHIVTLSNMIFPIARKNGVKVCISHSHSSKFSTSKVKAMRNKLSCIGLVKKSDYCFACSNLAAEKIFGKGIIKSEKYRIIYNAINQEKFKFNEEIRTEIRQKLGIENGFVIGHVGRFSGEKNHKFLIEVFSQVKKQIPNARLLLLGDGPLKGKVQEQVKQLNIEKEVMFLGNVPNVNEYLNAMDLFVLPSIYEGLGMVAIEAQSNGLQTLLSDAIPQEVVILKETKFLPLSTENWTNSIIECYNNGKDNERILNKLSENHNYDIRVQAEELVSFYLSAI